MSIGTTKKTLDGVEYDFKLMKFKKSASIFTKVIKLANNIDGADDNVIYDVASAVCDGLLADGFEVNFDDYFAGKMMLMLKVAYAGVTLNYPDIFESLGKLDKDSPLNAVADQLKSMGQVST